MDGSEELLSDNTNNKLLEELLRPTNYFLARCLLTRKRRERREKMLSAGYRRTEIDVVEERRACMLGSTRLYYLLSPPTCHEQLYRNEEKD